MKKIIVSIIARNEQEMIGSCLDSVKDADEIVVLDTGSNDRTVEICHRHRAKVFYHQWADDFAEARNKCLDYCRGDWIVVIDCDEVLMPGGMKEIRKAVEFVKPRENVFCLTVKTDVEEFQQPRVFRKDKTIYWTGKAHNQLNKKSDGVIQAVIRSGISPNHQKDPQRTLRILKGVLKENPTDARSAYFYGRELMRFGNYDAAIYWFEYYIDMTGRSPIQADAYYQLSLCFQELGREPKSIESLHHAVMVNENFTKAWERLAQVTKRVKYYEFSKLTTNENTLVTIY